VSGILLGVEIFFGFVIGAYLLAVIGDCVRAGIQAAAEARRKQAQ